MYEIKKIHPRSLANYLAVIISIIVFLFGLINFSISMLNVGTRIYWRDLLTSWFMSVIVFYVFAWITGFLFSVIYNFFALRIRGIIIDMEKVNISEIKKIQDEEQEKLENKNNFVV